MSKKALKKKTSEKEWKKEQLALRSFSKLTRFSLPRELKYSFLAYSLFIKTSLLHFHIIFKRGIIVQIQSFIWNSDPCVTSNGIRAASLQPRRGPLCWLPLVSFSQNACNVWIAIRGASRSSNCFALLNGISASFDHGHFSYAVPNITETAFFKTKVAQCL